MHNRFFKMIEVSWFVDSITGQIVRTREAPERTSKDGSKWRVVQQRAQMVKEFFEGLVEADQDQVWLESNIDLPRSKPFSLSSLEDHVSVVLAPSQREAEAALASLEEFLVTWFGRYWTTEHLYHDDPREENLRLIVSMEADFERAGKLMQIFAKDGEPELKERLGVFVEILRGFLPQTPASTRDLFCKTRLRNLGIRAQLP